MLTRAIGFSDGIAGLLFRSWLLTGRFGTRYLSVGFLSGAISAAGPRRLGSGLLRGATSPMGPRRASSRALGTTSMIAPPRRSWRQDGATSAWTSGRNAGGLVFALLAVLAFGAFRVPALA